MSTLRLTLALTALFVAGAAHADTVQPAHDLSGTWTVGAGGGANAYFQEGTALSYVNITGGYTHHFVGRYISPTKIEGIQHRVNRVDGCSTEMLMTLTAINGDTIYYTSRSLDSNCDLPKGLVLTGSISRLL